MRRISGEARIAKAPLRAPAPLAPVAPAPVAPPPTRSFQPPAPRGEQAWMAEMLFEAQFDPRTVHGAGTSEGAEAGEAAGLPFTRAELQGALEGLPPGQIPRNVEQYRALLARLFDPRAEAAIQDMDSEPVLESMRQVWTPGKPDVNRNVASEFMRYFFPKLAEAYDFRPCPVEFSDTLSGGFNGLYDLRMDRIYLPLRTLNGTFAEFVEVLAHEQMHCMQERLIGRMYLARDGVPLSPDERAIASYWRNEQPKYRSAMANGAEMSPETRKRYRQIGQEYHAIQTGAAMSRRLVHGAR